MKQLIFLVFVMTTLNSGAALGQRLETAAKVSRADFNGKWLYNFKESGPEKRKIEIPMPRFVTLRQDSAEVVLTTSSDKNHPELTDAIQHIYTDGRSFDHFPQMSERGFFATVGWEEGRLVTRIFDKDKKLVNRNEIELLANGKKLRIYGWHRNSMGDIFEEISIFDRAQ